mgnify:CR=1 FL=1
MELITWKECKIEHGRRFLPPGRTAVTADQPWADKMAMFGSPASSPCMRATYGLKRINWPSGQLALSENPYVDPNEAIEGRGTKKKDLPCAERPLESFRQRHTLPGVTPVPSALAGLTSLFGMGRGGHCRYSHLKDFNSLIYRQPNQKPKAKSQKPTANSQ